MTAVKKQSVPVAQIRESAASAIAALMGDIARHECAVGAHLLTVQGTYPDSVKGRAAFWTWAEKVTGRRKGMVRRYMVAATVLERVPSVEKVSVKADTLQFLAGLPDDDISAVVVELKESPATESAVKKAALKVSEKARERENRRKDRASESEESTRVANNKAIERRVSRLFAKFAEECEVLAIDAESEPREAIVLAMVRAVEMFGDGLQPRIVKKCAEKFLAGEHLASEEDDS